MPGCEPFNIGRLGIFIIWYFFIYPARLHKRIDAGLTSSGNLTSTKTLTNGSAKIQLRKLRDFSQNISDTFQFIKQELKPLLTAFVLVAGAFMLVSVILSGIYQKEAFGFLMSYNQGGFYQQNGVFVVHTGLFLSVIFSLVALAQ